MSRERTGTLILVSSPQNSKGPELPNINLLANPIFRGVVSRFDRALGVEPNQSLAESNQFASVVMSVASHSAFVYGLRGRLQPGILYPNDLDFQLRFVGHSVGEMGSLIEAGVCKIEPMAWILSERQRITEQPFATGVMRFMLAVVGVDIVKFEKGLDKSIKQAFGNTMRVGLANRNTPSQGVLSIEAPEGDPRSLAKRLGELFSEFRHPDSKTPPIFIHLRPIKNAFHSMVLGPEEKILQSIIAQKLRRENFRAPASEVVYSPMLRKWIKSDKDIWYLVNHQLTSEVYYSEGIQRLSQEKGLVAFIAADIKEETTPKYLRENSGGRIPVINIKDLQSLDQAIEETSELLLAA